MHCNSFAKRRLGEKSGLGEPERTITANLLVRNLRFGCRSLPDSGFEVPDNPRIEEDGPIVKGEEARYAEKLAQLA